MKYRIYKTEFGWNCVCPCGSWLEKQMSFEAIVRVFQWMLSRKVC